MAITFSQVYLPIDKDFRLIVPRPDRNIIGSDFLNPSTNRFHSEYLYIGKTSDLPPADKLSTCNLVLLEDQELEVSYFQADSLNLMITKCPAAFKRVQEKIRAIFDTQIKINNYAYNLLNMCLSGATAKEILDAGYASLGNPIMLFDASYNLIAHTGTQYAVEETLMDEIISCGYIPMEHLDGILEMQSSLDSSDYTRLVTWEEDPTERKKFMGKIIRNSQSLGYLIVFESNCPVNKMDRDFLAILCQFMSIAMVDAPIKNTSTNAIIEDFLIALLENRIHDKIALEERAESFNLVLYDSKVAITVDYANFSNEPNRLHLIKKRLQSHFNKNTLVLFNHQVVILLDTKNLHDVLCESRMESFERLLKEMNCTAGISRPFISLSEYQRHYKQAEACIEIMKKLSDPSIIGTYDDYKMAHMFLHFSEVCDLNDLICDEVKLLSAQDQEKGSNLVETLFCFVRNRQDITSTAKEMHLHYNTIKYRINRILELTQMDLDDHQKTYAVIISEKTLNLLKKTKLQPSSPASSYTKEKKTV